MSLERPKGKASFELNAAMSRPEPEPEPLIGEFVRLVEELPASTRALWDRASRRVFDIGLQSRRKPFQRTYSPAPETLSAAARVRAAIAVTIYALDPEDEQPT